MSWASKHPVALRALQSLPRTDGKPQPKTELEQLRDRLDRRVFVLEQQCFTLAATQSLWHRARIEERICITERQVAQLQEQVRQAELQEAANGTA